MLTVLPSFRSRRRSEVPLLRYETSGPRAVLTIDDPERRNPISNDVMRALLDGVRRAEADPVVRVVVLTGAGDRAFSAGGDLGGGFVDDPLATHGEREALADLFRSMQRCPKPIIARVNGHALAGGFGLAAACDIVVAVEHATFGTPEIAVGLWPMMITAVLQRLAPERAILDLMLTGRRIEAAEAMRLGVVSRVVAADRLDIVVDEIVDDLVAKSPSVLALGKTAFYAVRDLPLDAALDHLHVGLTAVALCEDAREGMAAFLEKRSPTWSGR